jgi:hypothetical protein
MILVRVYTFGHYPLWLSAIFPTKRNREFFSRNKEFFGGELGLADVTCNLEMRKTIMKKLTLSAAAIIAVAGVLASASANAEHNAGGPIVNGDQCFTYTKGAGHDATFGSWHACPKTSSATTTTTVTFRNGRKITRTVAAKPAAGPQPGAALPQQERYWGN